MKPESSGTAAVANGSRSRREAAATRGLTFMAGLREGVCVDRRAQISMPAGSRIASGPGAGGPKPGIQPLTDTDDGPQNRVGDAMVIAFGKWEQIDESLALMRWVLEG